MSVEWWEDHESTVVLVSLLFFGALHCWVPHDDKHLGAGLTIGSFVCILRRLSRRDSRLRTAGRLLQDGPDLAPPSPTAARLRESRRQRQERGRGSMPAPVTTPDGWGDVADDVEKAEPSEAVVGFSLLS